MRTPAIFLAVLLLIVPGMAGHSAADPIPLYFIDSHTSAICGTLQDAQFGTISVLVQINFDPVLNGGIDLATADGFFDQLATVLPVLGSFLGPDLQITCALKPSDMQTMFGFDGFELAEFASPSYESYGFTLYVILDVYNWVEPAFLGSAETLRADGFLVTGADDLSYVGSASVLRSLLP